jgi:hypothetical protein
LSQPQSRPSDHELSMMGEFVEACAWEDHYLAAPDYIRWEMGLHLDRLESAVVLSLTNSDDPFYSRVLGLGLNEAVREESVDEIMEYIYGTGTRLFTVHICPESQPQELHSWLQWRGFWEQDRHVKFFHGVKTPVQHHTDLRIELTEADYADAFAYVATEAFGLPDYMHPWMAACVGRPNWYHYVAWEGDQPAAAGALYKCGDVAWLGHGSTLPAFRRRGAQGALLTRRIQDGIDLGIKWFFTDTSEDLPDQPSPSYRNMLRSGFEQAYIRWNYIFQAY